jgi:lipoprotein-releasing system permease protein
MSVVFFLARKSLFQSRLTMALLIAAVAAGVGFQIPNAANSLGYQAELIEEGVAAGWGDVRVRPKNSNVFEDADALASRIAGYPSVLSAIPVMTMAGAVGKDGRFLGAPVTGLRAGGGNRPFRLIDGAMLEEGDDKGILLGSALATRLGVRTGDSVKLRVVLSTGALPGLEEGLGRYAMTVRGLVGGAFGAFEAVFVDRRFLGEEAGAPGAASMVVVYTGAPLAARDLASTIGAEIPEADARAWNDDSAYLKNAIQANEAVAAISRAMVVAAVAIPVLALLYINVLSRRREVGVLSAIGFGQAEIFAAFLLQALLVGVAGVAAGCGLGFGIVRYFQAHPIFEWEGFVIRPVLSAECFLRPSLIVLATTLAAGVYPAWRASRVDPARILRGLE